jgi:uncharacterized membrane protein YhhN
MRFPFWLLWPLVGVLLWGLMIYCIVLPVMIYWGLLSNINTTELVFCSVFCAILLMVVSRVARNSAYPIF